MTITYNYDRKDIFGNRVFTSDTTSFGSKVDIKKVFSAFRRDPLSAIYLQHNDNEETYSFIWEHYNDCENDVVTIIYSPKWNIRETPKTMSLAKARNFAYKLMEE